MTVEEFFAIYGTEDGRYELIDGIPYMMASPNTGHQEISLFLTLEIGNFLKGKKCKLYVAPYDVFLNESPKDEVGKAKKNRRVKGTVVQPDLMVVCDSEKIKPDGCHGAPDLAIEILSISTEDKDKGLKFHKYFSSGVREYWLIDPAGEYINVYSFTPGSKKYKGELYSFEDKVKSHVLDGLEIDFAMR